MGGGWESRRLGVSASPQWFSLRARRGPPSRRQEGRNSPQASERPAGGFLPPRALAPIPSGPASEAARFGEGRNAGGGGIEAGVPTGVGTEAESAWAAHAGACAGGGRVESKRRDKPKAWRAACGGNVPSGASAPRGIALKGSGRAGWYGWRATGLPTGQRAGRFSGGISSGVVLLGAVVVVYSCPCTAVRTRFKRHRQFWALHPFHSPHGPRLAVRGRFFQ